MEWHPRAGPLNPWPGRPFEHWWSCESCEATWRSDEDSACFLCARPGKPTAKQYLSCQAPAGFDEAIFNPGGGRAHYLDCCPA